MYGTNFMDHSNIKNNKKEKKIPPSLNKKHEQAANNKQQKEYIEELPIQQAHFMKQPWEAPL